MLAAIGATALLITFTPLVAWWTELLRGPWRNPAGDVMIVLGADTVPHGDVLGEASYWRAAWAVRVWREGRFRRIVLTGGGQPPVAVQMKDYLLGHGVPAEAILMETAARSTRENAAYVKSMDGAIPGKKVLVTSDFHMFRAVRVFRRAGIPVEPLLVPDVLIRQQTWSRRIPAFIDLAGETVKIGWYKVRGWI